MYLLLFVDRYVLEAWRLQENFTRFYYLYQDKESYYHAPSILLMLSMMFADSKTLASVYSKYGRYVICLVSFVGMLFIGRYPYRVRSIFSIALFILGFINIASSLNKLTEKPKEP